MSPLSAFASKPDHEKMRFLFFPLQIITMSSLYLPGASEVVVEVMETIAKTSASSSHPELQLQVCVQTQGCLTGQAPVC